MKFFLILLVLISQVVFAEQLPPLPLDQCIQHAPYGFPSTKKKSVSHICRKGYFVSHDNIAKIPVFASYVLTPKNAVGCLPRVDAFAPDKSLPIESRASLKDYAKSTYDTGHMVNDSDNRYDKQAEQDSFILSNMTPQLKAFNRGIWKKLEDHTRGWAVSRDNDLLVYVGPVYNRYLNPTIGEGRVTVPHAFFKIIVDLKTFEVQPFLFKHEGSKEPLSTFITSVANIQEVTGIVFPLPGKPKYNKLWDVKMKSARSAKAGTCNI